MKRSYLTDFLEYPLGESGEQSNFHYIVNQCHWISIPLWYHSHTNLVVNLPLSFILITFLWFDSIIWSTTWGTSSRGSLILNSLLSVRERVFACLPQTIVWNWSRSISSSWQAISIRWTVIWRPPTQKSPGRCSSVIIHLAEGIMMLMGTGGLPYVLLFDKSSILV